MQLYNDSMKSRLEIIIGKKPKTGNSTAVQNAINGTDIKKISFKIVDSDVKGENDCYNLISQKITKSKSYLDFVDNISNSNKEKLEGYFLLVNIDNELWTFRSYLTATSFYLVDIYEFESNEMKSFLIDELLKLNNTNYKILEANENNNYNAICNPEILRVILSEVSIKSHNEQLFYEFQIPKKSGGMRDIIAPHEEVRNSLKKLNTKLQLMYDGKNEDFQIAYKKGKCVKDGALIHKDNKHIFNIDLKDFYPSCKKELIKRYMEPYFKCSYNRQLIEDKFYDIILKDDGLFIGNPISGTLLNAVVAPVAKYMKCICKNFGMEFSMYADDMTFSSPNFIKEETVYNIFNKAFTQYNLDSYFKINKKKSHGLSDCRRNITGVSINNRNETTISKKYYRILRASLNNLSLGKDVNIKELQGKLAYATMIDDSSKTYRLIQKYKTIIEKYHIVSKESMKKLNAKFAPNTNKKSK